MFSSLLLALALQDVDQLIRDLGADDVDTREKATQALIAVGYPAAEKAHMALASTTDAEIKARLRSALLAIDPWFESKLLATLPVYFRGYEDSARPMFASTGRAVAYLGNSPRKSGQWIVVGETRGETYDEVSWPALSPDGHRVIYWAAKKGKEYAIVDGTSSEAFDEVFGPVFSPDFSTVAFGASTADRSFVIVGDKRIETFDRSPYPVMILTFCPDGKTPCYAVRKNGKAQLVVGEKRTDTGYDEIRDLKFSPDGKRTAYRANVGGKPKKYGPIEGGKWTMVVDGKPGEEFDYVGEPHFSPDSRIMAYLTKQGGKQRVVIGDSKTDEFDYVCRLDFSPDGKRVALTASTGKDQWLIVGDEKTKIDCDFLASPVFSPDGSKVAVEAERFSEILGPEVASKTRVVIGKFESEEFDDIGIQGIRFSPDGKRIALGARIGLELWWKVLDVP